jgi:16S rRNA G966 N2-methylase RsmD
MQYKYTKNYNYEDYASGRFFYAQPNSPAFPARLASEIFQRSLQHWQTAGGQGKCTIYDPVCGGAYGLVVLAYLHWDAIESIYASDIDGRSLMLAEKNLSLITSTGQNQRIQEIERMLIAYHKESHRAALKSAQKFRKQLDKSQESHVIGKTLFQADATQPCSLAIGLGNVQIDLVLADVPYGWKSEWRVVRKEQKIDQTPVWLMLDALQGFLKENAVVAISVDKSQKVAHQNYRRCERFQVGKRRIFILQKET